MELNEIQKIKMALLVMNHANVENAQKACDFVMADSKEPANQEEATQSEMADRINQAVELNNGITPMVKQTMEYEENINKLKENINKLKEHFNSK